MKKIVLACVIAMVFMVCGRAQSADDGCAPIGQLPFSYGFEDEVAGQTADAANRFATECWKVFGRRVDNEPFVSVGNGVNNTMPHDGLNALAGYSASYPGTVLVLPEFESQIDNLLFGVWVSRDTAWNPVLQDYDTATGVELGYLTDADDPASFVVVATCVPEEALGWEYFQAALPVGVDGRLAIRYIASDAIANVFIDDISVSLLSDAPRDFSVVEYGSDTATFIWLSSEMEVAWLLEYTATVTNTVNTVEVLSKPCTITGLTPLTHYSVRVAAVNGDGIRSLWSQPVEFTTFETNVAIDEVDAVSEVTIFPNPARDMVTVVAGVGANVSLLDISGRQLLCAKSVDGRMVIDVTPLPKGTYILRVVSSEGVSVKRLIVE
ncbi:MAG: T9SS type A sorting domain-containing protein [Bacteroidales bacterium]|nr:T9SS type A sorting domain-containing protein [Bacteroidales bacterium]